MTSSWASVYAPSRQTHSWLAVFRIPHVRSLAYRAVRQWMDLILWRNPIFARIFFKHLLAQTVNFKLEICDETSVLTSRTRRISHLPSSLPLKIPDFQCAAYVINVTITDAFPPEARETPAQHKSFKYNMTRGKVFHNFVNHNASIIQF